ncbi:vWA domain-containing protein [Kaistella antarctica]|uniref:Mg-chelatase subunit ChlD n=1 Tax=Kaistella antarctica TaxID=266748 RepID=A0A448NUX1_9FLAO|nr:VWA domain-containing protein [Kaistella antarctica]KEY20300.1 von Willebrand factor A [Kaistella antarctica]SEV91270.1 Ca-activated chloride channel family protein [Kaistella antarctica]VEI01577.1 Mg-chelatase subunit ChlD [Kaistella antarctica]
MNWTLGNSWYLLLLLLLPLLGILMVTYLKWKKGRKNIFAEAKFQDELFERKSAFSKILPFLYLIATLFLVLSIVDLLIGSEEVKTKQKMNNVIFLLDVSNSMNAQDVEPNRLDEAKNIIINTMAKMKNDKIGVVVFAGEASSIMPLTTDYQAAETYLGGVETSILKIQGTDYLIAMQTVVNKFKNIPKGARQVVLLSDGEDNEGNEKAATKLAMKEGISVISVGIGSEEGAPIPEYVFGQLMGYKTDQSGQTVISKRENLALKNIAAQTNGAYVDGNVLENATTEIIDGLRKSATSSESMVKSNNAIHYYQYFLGVSLLFFLLIFLLNPKRDFNI